MCHQFLCEDCEGVAWDFCHEASDFHVCPNFSQTTYKTERRCHSCEVISGAIDDLGFWLARHPERHVDYDGPESEDHSISEKSLTDSDDETDKKAAAKPESPWDYQSATTLDEEEGEGQIKEKYIENIEPMVSEVSDNYNQDCDHEQIAAEEYCGKNTSESASSDICMGW